MNTIQNIKLYLMFKSVNNVISVINIFAASSAEFVYIWGLTSMVEHLLKVDPFNYFTLQPILHNWYNKGFGMCYPVCGMVHIKDSMLLIGKSSPCGCGHRFSPSLYD